MIGDEMELGSIDINVTLLNNITKPRTSPSPLSFLSHPGFQDSGIPSRPRLQTDNDKTDQSL